MISLPSIRKGLRNLSLVALSVIAVVSIAVAATPGFPLSEDFTADNLKDPATTADGDTTGAGTLRMGFASDLTAMTLNRSPLGGGGEDQLTTRDIVAGDFDGDGDLDVALGNEGTGISGANMLYFNNGGAFNTAAVTLGNGVARRTRGLAVG